MVERPVRPARYGPTRHADHPRRPEPPRACRGTARPGGGAAVRHRLHRGRLPGRPGPGEGREQTAVPRQLGHLVPLVPLDAVLRLPGRWPPPGEGRGGVAVGRDRGGEEPWRSWRSSPPTGCRPFSSSTRTPSRSSAAGSAPRRSTRCGSSSWTPRKPGAARRRADRCPQAFAGRAARTRGAAEQGLPGRGRGLPTGARALGPERPDAARRVSLLASALAQAEDAGGYRECVALATAELAGMPASPPGGRPRHPRRGLRGEGSRCARGEGAAHGRAGADGRAGR